MLFSKAIIQAEWEANAPLREALAIKRERLRAKRAAKPAFNLEAALDGAHGCIFRSQIGLHLWGGQWGALGPRSVPVERTRQVYFYEASHLLRAATTGLAGC